MSNAAGKSRKGETSPFAKLAIELGPLLLFFAVNAYAGIMAATGAFMAAVTAALAVNYALTRKIAAMPLITAALVMVFGGLTLYLNDELFIKIKPTLINLLFAAILAGGLMAGRLLLKSLMGTMIEITDRGWRLLTWRWIGLFVALALLNEFVWRSFSTDVWVNFKVFGLLPLTLVFAMAQTPLLQRHALGAHQAADDARRPDGRSSRL